MKKKFFVFLCVIAVLFFGSCADLSMDDEKAIKADLPPDFDWQVYGDINGDVLMSQIIIDIREKKIGADIKSCVDVFSSDIGFAEIVYKDYLQCPVNGWDKTKVCTGKYANNGKYNKKIISPKLIAAGEGDDSSSSGESGGSSSSVDSGDSSSSVDSGSSSSSGELGDSSSSVEPSSSSESGNSSSSGDSSSSVEPSSSSESPTLCAIGNCWSGGWDELKTLLPNKLDVVGAMCQFIPKDLAAPDAKKYLEDFKKSKIDPYLVEQHYHFYGRMDGRPYKYCKDGQKGDPKDQEKHATKRTKLNKEDYYDYSKYTFCLDTLDKNNQKIYVVK